VVIVPKYKILVMVRVGTQRPSVIIPYTTVLNVVKESGIRIARMAINTLPRQRLKSQINSVAALIPNVWAVMV
jgi:hypothetical protein